MDIVIQTLLFFAVFKLGQWSIIWPMRSALRKIAAKNGIDLDRLLREHVENLDQTPESNTSTEREMEIERVGSVYYAYASDGEFLAQGADFRTMFDVIKQRFPGENFRISDYRSKFTEAEADRLIASLREAFEDQKK